MDYTRKSTEQKRKTVFIEVGRYKFFFYGEIVRCETQMWIFYKYKIRIDKVLICPFERHFFSFFEDTN